MKELKELKRLHRQEVDLNKDLLKELDNQYHIVNELKDQIEFFGEQLLAIKAENALLKQKLKRKELH